MTRRRFIADTWTATTASLTGDQAVHLALLEHHGAERDRVGEMIASHLLGPAAVLP